MAQIRKGGKKEVPGVNTSSLPDIVFMLLFFFMATTTMKEYQKMYGKESRVQLDDAFAEVDEIEMFIENERNAMKESDQGLLTVSIKADKDTKMGIITDIKQALRRAQALKINYAATKRMSY